MKIAATLRLSLGFTLSLALGLGLGLLGACTSSQQPETVTPATSGSSGAGGSTTAPGGPGIAAEAYGAVCSDTTPCAAGLSCATYYGIAGPNGPAFQSCELKCTSDKECPSDTSCISIADGPGSVCRPKS